MKCCDSFKSILRWKSVNVRLTKAEICAPVQSYRYTTNDAYHDIFNWALERGQWFYTPCLGWKEFAPDYPACRAEANPWWRRPVPPGDTRMRNGEPRTAHHAADGVRPDAGWEELNGR